MSSGNSASIRRKIRSELRIVLIGERHGGEPSGKSSVGNIILGRDVFDTSRITSKSVMRQKEVSGRKVTVVDTPGWMSDHPLDLTPTLTQLEIQQSVNLCPLGPHAFVLVIRLDRPYVGTGMSAEEHVRFLLSDRVWKHTIVVFTVGDKNNIRPDLIKSDSDLRYLTEKCQGRFIVLNISDRGSRSGVTKLMNMIDQMVKSNGCHYETEEHVSEELKERTIRRRAEQRRTDAQKQTGLPKHIGLTDLRIVLLGRQYSGKSSAGNTILTGSGFKVSQAGQRSVQCEVRQGEVAGRQVTVVDSPGWWYNSPLQDISEMDKLEIQNSVSLCPPGPHAALLTVPLHEAFTKAQRVAVEEHMTLLSQSLWSHSMVLFTYGDCLGDRSIEQHIEAEGEDLRWLLDKCGNRYHVFNIEKTDDTQVTQLFEKIDEMVAGNRGGHCEVEGDEKMSERKRNIEEHVQTFLKKTHRQRDALKALSEGEYQSLSDVRLMVVGGEQNDRNTAGNRILQQYVFKETLFKEFKTQTKLAQCVRQQERVADRNVSVVNCTDWSTTPPSQKIKDVLLHGVTLCSPGPHAVLVTVDVRSSFSEADRRSVEEHMELLGDRVWRNTLVLFTQGWWLEERCVEEYIESEGEPLRWILEKCGHRYHVLDGVKWDISEVEKLMKKTEDMVMMNRGHFKVGRETRKKTLLDRLKGKKTFTEEEWNRGEEEWKKREQEMIERMLRFVVPEPEEPTLPEEWKKTEQKMRERMLRFVVTVPEEPSMDLEDVSGGTPSETGSVYSWSTDEVSSSHHGSIAPSSGYGSSDTLNQASTDYKVSLMNTIFHRLKGKTTLTEEDWNRRQEQWRRREQETIDRMLKFVVMEPEEPSLPAVRRSNRMDHSPPSMSGGTLSETLRHLPPDKVSDWLQKRHPEPIASSSGADTTSEASTQPALCVNMSSEEKEDEDSEDCMNMMKMMKKIESGEEELNQTDLDDYDNDEVYLGSCCEKCQHVQQSYGDEMIIPEKLSRGRLQAQLEGQRTYECALTGLIFEASEQVLVSYSILSWSKFNEFVQNPWTIAGPIFNVQTVNKDASALKSIQFPHSLCLAGQEKEKVFAALHFTGKDPIIERVQSSGSHLKWQVSSLCPVGAIALDTQQDEHHGAVLIYKDLGSSVDTHTFRIYLALNSSSWHEDIKRELEFEKGHFCRVYKNPNCLLVEGKYQLMSKPREEIHPENLPFTLKPTEFKGYFEASFKQPLPVTFNVKLRGSDDTTWSANIQQGDLEKKQSMLQVLLGWFQLGSRQSNPCEATVSLLEQQSLHPDSEPNTEPDSHHVQSDGSSTTALKPSLSGGFSDDETVAEGVMQVAGASAVTEPQISQTTDNFVKKNWGDLIRRVTDVMGIADDLYQKEILSDETYQEIWIARPRQAQMRILLHTVNLKGTAAISAFYEALQQHESCLFNDLVH